MIWRPVIILRKETSRMARGPGAFRNAANFGHPCQIRNESRQTSNLSAAIRKTLARPWAFRHTGTESIAYGGLEKQDVTATSIKSSYHENDVSIRAAKVEAVRAGIPLTSGKAIRMATWLIG